ncbi:MAG: fatty acid desaturase [Paracoccaceae bacterium]
MPKTTIPPLAETEAEAPCRDARQWVHALARYRDPSGLRSFVEILVTLVPLLSIWALAYLALSVSGWLALGLSVLNGFFLVRLFAIQHDCGHAAFFRQRALSDWVGRCIGVLTLTPYDVWRRSHSIHHSGSGNLDRRGMGDIHTLTVGEYAALSRLRRLQYRLYRNPVVLFVIGPFYIFFLNNRLPFGLMRAGLRYWVSAIGTNIVIAGALAVVWYFAGLAPILLIWLPTSMIAAMLGVWLFYVQHQFETTHWDREENWQLHDAALHGSSHYVMPAVLQWLTANIGVHHVHHLYSRIPFYRLPEVLRDHPVLAQAQRITIPESIANARLHLWDEKDRRLLSYAEARRLYGRTGG